MIQYRKMKHGDENKVSVFIAKVFNQFVAPLYSKEGIDEFLKYIRPDAIERQLEENHFAMIALSDFEIIGIIEIRNYNHVALFFVDSNFQRKGIGKKLLQKALEICLENDLNASRITVNASPNSTIAYKTFGFAPIDSEKCVNGIRFVPMALIHV